MLLVNLNPNFRLLIRHHYSILFAFDLKVVASYGGKLGTIEANTENASQKEKKSSIENHPW